jgi:hypothetical protein
LNNKNENRGRCTEKEEKKEKMLRLKVIEKILNSEVVYLQQLETLAQVYFKTFRTKNTYNNHDHIIIIYFILFFSASYILLLKRSYWLIHRLPNYWII